MLMDLLNLCKWRSLTNMGDYGEPKCMQITLLIKLRKDLIFVSRVILLLVMSLGCLLKDLIIWGNHLS